MTKKKQRLDTLLVDLQLCDSRQKAQRLIRAGEVKVNNHVVDKPGTEVDITLPIELQEKCPYVSRGGYKLAKALEVFAIDVEGRICLDGGISTGGFTDCLLQAGAKQVYGVDVGYGQVAWKIRQDERVILKERTNLRHLSYDELYDGKSAANIGVVDVSFISLTKILAPLGNLLASPRELILLVKPQFEVGKSKVGKKGVVRNSKDQALAIYQVLETAQNLEWQYHGLTWSPVTGPAGNIEYLLWLSMEPGNSSPDLATIELVTNQAKIDLLSTS